MIKYLNGLMYIKKSIRLNLLLFYLIAGVASISSAQNTMNSNNSWSDSHNSQSLNNFKSGDYYLLKIDPYCDCIDSVLNEFDIVKKLINHSYIVRFDSGLAHTRIQYSDSFHFSTPSNQWKQSLNITKNENEYLNGKYWVRITDLKEWKQTLENESRISTIDIQGDFVKIKVSNVSLMYFLANDYITYIEKAADEPKSEGVVLDLNLHPNRINTIQAYLPDINGEGELISVKEPFYDTKDIDIIGRYVDLGTASEFTDLHTLDMTTIIAGNGNSSLMGLGVAPMAQHTSSSNAGVAPDADEYFIANGIQTQNHSYGTEIESFYGAAAALYDQQAYRNPQITHVFSVGNSGYETADHGAYKELGGFANITGNFKQAKNVLTIGAVDTTMNTIEMNSNGPAFDGRIKPEIVTYSMTGTSNSAALVSGVAVLLQQVYREMNNQYLSNSLTKALLINTADDIGEMGPSHKTGYGSLNAYSAMQQLQNQQFINDELIQSDEKRYKIAIPENAVNIRATLVWTDPAAAANDAIALVNDLNMEIKDENGQTHLPWVLSTEANLAALNAAATRGVDHLNTIEQVYIDKTDSDSLEIVITSQHRLDTMQSFSIAYGWEIKDEFSWTSPTFQDNVPYNGKTTTHIRWESSYAQSTAADLYFKLSGEDEWKIIEENVQLSDENYRWDPFIYNNHAQLKMDIAGKSYVSDTFAISEPIRLNVGFDCSDSLSFYWKPIPEVDYYTLFNLKGSKMTAIVSIQDTSLTISKSDLESTYLKVQAIKNGKPLIQGTVIDYLLQAATCFLKSYYVESIQGEGVNHYVSLSGLTGIDKIHLEKQSPIDAKWEVLAELESNSFESHFLEQDPDNGVNSYRLLIYFSNGEKVMSEIQTAYYVKSSNFIVYPNPVSQTDDLRVHAKEIKPEAIITFFNLQGQELSSFPVPNVRNYIDVSFLREGLYLYRITDKDEQLSQGKVLKLK